jgi:hypothetical protein
MIRLQKPLIVGLVLLALPLSAAMGQQQQSVFSRKYSGYDPLLDRPAVSPYMQLMTRDNASSVPYYSMVRPQLDAIQMRAQASRQMQQLQGQVNMLGARPGNVPVPTTGHQTRFGDLSHYYGNSPAAMSGRR